ncbi:MAG: MmgE/PrpD family protein, partial [Acidimicrobiia bacterium]|nr:MmgE/PrpD family protein [Acidimicrobiia bacterium]
KDHPGYRQASLDWLACAWAGRNERAPKASRANRDDRVASLAVSGHVLDFDDTYGPGLAHLSAPTAPAALVLGATTGTTMGRVLDAYTAGFEAMGALARAGHPDLYERGWHPTAVTGTVGAATAAAHLFGFDEARTRVARQLAILGAGGLQAAFGSDGKSLQVGMAAAQGVRAAVLAGQGGIATRRIEEAYETVYGGHWEVAGSEPAIEQNWIKAFPCCLQTHSSIEAAEQAAQGGADPDGRGVVTVHRRSRQAAPLDDVTTGLEAKFSIPYTVAFTLLHGAPTVEDFVAVDEGARRVASCIEVQLDDRLDQAAAVLSWHGAHDPIEIRVEAARGSPPRPMSNDQLRAKVHALAGTRFDGVLDDPERPAADVLARVEEQ